MSHYQRKIIQVIIREEAHAHCSKRLRRSRRKPRRIRNWQGRGVSNNHPSQSFVFQLPTEEQLCRRIQTVQVHSAPVKLSRDQYLMGSNNASWTLSKAHNVDGLTRSSRTCPVSALLRPESCRTERLHMLSPCLATTDLGGYAQTSAQGRSCTTTCYVLSDLTTAWPVGCAGRWSRCAQYAQPASLGYVALKRTS